MAPLIVQLSFLFAYAVPSEATLSFLGLGAVPPTPTWGNIMAEGRQYMREAAWIITTPGVALMITVSRQASAGTRPLAAARIEPLTPTRILEVRGPDYFVYARETGLFEPVVKLREMVRAGQPATRVHRPEMPWAPPLEHHFLRDGFVLCQHIPGRTQRGDCLFHLGTHVAA